jgi:hypothetical protein
MVKSTFDDDYEKELRREQMDLDIESRKNKRALQKMTKSADFSPFLEDDRATPYQDMQDINGSFNGVW